jgi:hypothetical protein
MVKISSKLYTENNLALQNPGVSNDSPCTSMCHTTFVQELPLFSFRNENIN